MDKKHVLIPGGYGAVGKIVATLLAGNAMVMPVIAGRNESKAKALAKALDCQWAVIDLENKESIRAALNNINIVINCYIPSEDFNIMLAKISAGMGIHYMDVAGFNGFNARIADLHDNAVQSNATLITALGLFPGMSGIILASLNERFDHIESADIFFTSGGNMDTLSPLSLQGIGHMMGEKPRQWENNQWVNAPGTGHKEYIGEPFNKQITFYPYMVTYDLVQLPRIINIDKLVMWSMSESMLTGVVLMLGLKMGLARTLKGAGRFLKVLKYLGRNQNSDYSLKIVVRGTRAGKAEKVTVEMNAAEEYLTAVVPVIVCEQIAGGDIDTAGAFTGANVIDTQKFITSLNKYRINFRQTFELL